MGFSCPSYENEIYIIAEKGGHIVVNVDHTYILTEYNILTFFFYFCNI